MQKKKSRKYNSYRVARGGIRLQQVWGLAQSPLQLKSTKMQCFTPFRVRNKSKDHNNQNLMVNVPCGKCLACKKRRASHWSFRLNEEAKTSSSACFITLTYENAPVSENGFRTLNKRDFQLFLKRLRKTCPTNKLKYYACGEYGTQTHRPHYHAIIFNLPKSLIQSPQKIADTWQNGHIHLANNNQLTINYVVGYMTKSNFTRFNNQDDRLPEFSLMSKKMGLGYLTEAMKNYYKKREIFCIVRESGQIISMPRYYKEKIFEKKQLKEMYKKYIEEQETNFDEMFNSAKDEHEHYKNIIRRDNKQQLLTRQKI